MRTYTFIFMAAALAVGYGVSRSLPLTLLFGLALLWAYRKDSKRWHDKPNDELAVLVTGQDWRNWQAALEELQRREQDLAPYATHFVAGLVADSIHTRTASESMLKRFYPQLKEDLRGYSPMHDVAASRTRLAGLLERVGIE